MKKTIIGILLFILVFSYSIFYVFNVKNGKMYYVQIDFVADFDDKRKVSGFSENIFVGKVKKANIKTFRKITNKYSEYEVEVIGNIKGNLTGEILVNQDILSYDFFGYKTKVDGIDELEKGNTYIFAVSGDEHIILSHKNGFELLENGKENENLDIINVRKDAYINEIYYEGSHIISTYKNAYKDLSDEEKELFESREISF